MGMPFFYGRHVSQCQFDTPEVVMHHCIVEKIKINAFPTE
jgi:hypothetical protein